MTKAIFTTRIDPSYNDSPEQFYHFPKQYLSRVKKTIGDWIVYYEPSRTGKQSARRDGRKAYFAIAQVVSIREDHQIKDHYYADVTGYMEFDRSIPFRENDHFYESALRSQQGQTATGVFQNAVRAVPEEEYGLLLQAGFATILTEQEPAHIEMNQPGLKEEQQIFQRPIIEQITKRPFRDVAFKHNIRRAYDSTCAITGLKLINGGGRCEIEAAHIRPVGDGHNGPDSIRNGLALSRTFHWMFDRGLISLSNDHKILTAENLIPDQVQGMLPRDHKIQIPNDPALQPHPQYLEYHRDTIFKG
ncbi:MAG: HNH endonuclease [Rhodospirillales bacterium]|nr:HNH endonuclease [Rhodospirillales bacterium]